MIAFSIGVGLFVALILWMGFRLKPQTWGNHVAVNIDILLETIIFNRTGVTLSAQAFVFRAQGGHAIMTALANLLDRLDPNAGGPGVAHCQDAVNFNLALVNGVADYLAPFATPIPKPIPGVT